MINKLVVYLITVALGAACTPTVGNSVEGDGTCTEDFSGACVECVTSADCDDPTPVCGSGGVCTAACAGTEVNADFITAPSDIIFVVDQSGSMNQETAYVQTKINEFAASISASAIDYRVVMIARTTGNRAICVPPPLGGPACGNNTRFRLVDQEVDSNDGPELAISQYSRYADFLRPGAAKHFVFITDDNSDMSAAAFTAGVMALAPAGMFGGFKVHGIYAYGMGNDGCDGPFGSGAENGTVYTTLIAQTMGAAGVICSGDWTQVLKDIQLAVVSGSRVSCELALPETTTGGSLDPTKVNVKYHMGGAGPGQVLPQVYDAAACTAAGGWYYDDNDAPTAITLCPTTCSGVQADPAASLKVEFGCSTQIF